MNIKDLKSAESHLDLAEKFLGYHERTHTSTLSQFFRKSIGLKYNPAVTAWCALFANSVLQAAGKGTAPGKKTLARDFLKYGTPTDKPTKGDIAVFKRGNSSWQGHVGFYIGKGREGYVKVLGGNQDNKVCVKEYPISKLLGYRKPPKAVDLNPKG